MPSLLRAGAAAFPWHPQAPGAAEMLLPGLLAAHPPPSAPPSHCSLRKPARSHTRTRSGGGRGPWARQSSDLHQDWGVMSPPCPGAGSPLLTLLSRGLISQGGSEKSPFPGGMPMRGGSHTTSHHHSVTQPKGKSTGTITVGHWDRLERLSLPATPPDLPGSGCLSHPPALRPPEDAGRTRRPGTRGAGGPPPSQYLTLRFVFRVRPQAQTDGSRPS